MNQHCAHTRSRKPSKPLSTATATARLISRGSLGGSRCARDTWTTHCWLLWQRSRANSVKWFCWEQAWTQELGACPSARLYSECQSQAREHAICIAAQYWSHPTSHAHAPVVHAILHATRNIHSCITLLLKCLLLKDFGACSWFELDQDEVVDLKGRLLDAAGASKQHGQQAKHPLKTGSYVSAVANLTDASWPSTLTQTG